jgi:hypothetical protein
MPGLRAPVASGGPEMQPVVRHASWRRLQRELVGAGCLRVYRGAIVRLVPGLAITGTSHG